MRFLSYIIAILSSFTTHLSYSSTDNVDREGTEYFNLEAKLPDMASFINVEAKYISLTPRKCAIEEQPTFFPEITVQGSKTVTLKDEQSQDRKNINQRIPLSYHKDECHMWLYGIDLVFSATYGSEDWQDATTGVIIDVLRQRPESAPEFDEDGTLAVNSTCSWLFRTDDHNISKILFCSPVDADNKALKPLHSWKAWKGASHVTVGINELSEKTIKLDFKISHEEQPTFEDPWIKTTKGWLLCETEEDSPFCKTPMAVDTFKMNGHECTVYPDCTE